MPKLGNCDRCGVLQADDERAYRMNSDADYVVERMTECTLATIEHLIWLKRKSKSEVDRQIGIAQIGIDYIKANGIKTSGRKQGQRVLEVISKHEGSVAAWSGLKK